MKLFLWNYGMFEQMKFCGGFIISILMGITRDKGPLCIPDLRQIYLYWQWFSGTPEKLLVRGFILSLVPCELPVHGDKTSAGSVLDCLIKVGGECTVFSTLPVLYTPNWTTVCPVMQIFMGGGKHLSLMGGGNSVTGMFYPFGCIASTPGPWVRVTLGSAARYAYPVLDASPEC